MNKKVIGKCPICGGKLKVKSLSCDNCETEINGSFELSRFDYLTEAQANFVLVFLKNAGNIKMIEKELGISYPTVKKLMEEINNVLGLPNDNLKNNEVRETREDILTQLKNDEITFEEAEAKLKYLKENE